MQGILGYLCSRGISYYDELVTKKKEKRVKMTNEIFNNIKVLKMNGWEKLFETKLKNIYKEEIKY